MSCLNPWLCRTFQRIFNHKNTRVVHLDHAYFFQVISAFSRLTFNRQIIPCLHFWFCRPFNESSRANRPLLRYLVWRCSSIRGDLDFAECELHGWSGGSKVTLRPRFGETRSDQKGVLYNTYLAEMRELTPPSPPPNCRDKGVLVNILKRHGSVSPQTVSE